MNVMKTTRKMMLTGLAVATLLCGYSAGKASAAAPTAPAAPMMYGFQGSNLDFDLVNRTGYEIKHVLISPSRQAEWNANDDVLKGRRFEEGTKLHITFSHHAHAVHWDIKVVYDDHTSKEFNDLNLDNITKVTLWYDHRTDKTRAEIQ